MGERGQTEQQVGVMIGAGNLAVAGELASLASKSSNEAISLPSPSPPVTTSSKHTELSKQQQIVNSSKITATADKNLNNKLKSDNYHQEEADESSLLTSEREANNNDPPPPPASNYRPQKTDIELVSKKKTTSSTTSTTKSVGDEERTVTEQQDSSSRKLNPLPAVKQLQETATSTQDTDNNNNSNIEEKFANCKKHQLTYLQILLLRRWPCLAILICIMCSLIFGMLLSALTVYFMHGMTDCSNLALAASAAANTQPFVSAAAEALAHHDIMRRPAGDYDTPLELASLASSGGSELGRGHYSAALSMSPQSGLQAPDGSAGAAAQFRRLPSSLWPIHYDLFIQPYIAEPFNFTGKVSIRIICSEPTDNITLHSNELAIDANTLTLNPIETNLQQQPANSTRLQRRSEHNAKEAPKIKGLSQDKELQYSIIQLDRPLEVGREYLLSMDFVGYLNDDLAGFYKIKYVGQNSTDGEITWVAATQFQATDARRAFPCFDEPLYKATFSIQIKHWKNMTALSNMPIIDRKDSADGLWVTDTFEKSHRMSTYLVAYAVTNFESRSEGNISVWTRPGLAHTAEYALKIAGRILRHYEDFFGIAYPLPKMDMIALPDFNAGAMENWGLITYRETAMLYDETSSSVANKQRVAVVVAHELAHQWFGNLVTPKWWDDLWLNEGFASYVEYIGVDFVEPKWRMLEQFVLEELQNVFKLDILASSHQISIPVNNPDEISEIFDHISYSKGSSIIRMMSNFLTEEIFKAGLRRYLSALKYSNAEQKDLWAHLTEAQKLLANNGSSTTMLSNSGKPVDVEKVMNSWTLQTGYPLVTLTRSYGQPSQQATIEQVRHRAKLSPMKSSSSANNKTTQLQQPAQKWEIPITFTSKSEQNWQPVTRLWLHQDDPELIQLNSSILPSKQTDNDWILLNVNQVGYYRVNYDLRNWRLLLDQLMEDHTKISTINRAQIMDDLFDLAKGGFLDYRFAMNATKYIKKEVEFLPYDSMFVGIAYIDDMLHRTPLYGDWRDYISQLMLPPYQRYKNSEWTIRGSSRSTNETVKSDMASPTDDPNDVLAHYNLVNAIAWGCQVDDHCKQKAKKLFNEWRSSGKNIINPALRYTVYCTNIEHGSKDEWNFLWKVYTKEQNASEKDRILRALSCSKEHWILARYLEWIFDKSKPIRRQDGAFVFRTIGKNEYGRDIAFDFMRERWSTIKEHYGKSSFSMGNLVRSVAGSMNTQLELTQLKSFYEQIKADVGNGKRAFQIAIDEVENNIAWRERSYKSLEDWLQNELATNQ